MTKYEIMRSRYESSGMTAKIFAKQENISVATLYKWLKKAGEIQRTGEFVNLEVSKTKPGQIRIQTPQGVLIDIPI
jgi:predicted transcriptional regulator